MQTQNEPDAVSDAGTQIAVPESQSGLVNTRSPLSDPKVRARFFVALGRHRGIIAPACRAAGIASHHVEYVRTVDPEFAAVLADARRDAGDYAEAAAYARAIDGVKRPMVS